MKVNIIPRIVNKLRRCIAIVEDGDTCSISGGIASGKWIIWKGGLYQTSEAISYGSSFTVGTNLTAKDGGIGNQLQTQISELDSKLDIRVNVDHLSVGKSSSGSYIRIYLSDGKYYQWSNDNVAFYINYRNADDTNIWQHSIPYST